MEGKKTFDEVNISQIPARDILVKMGYKFISREEAIGMRSNLSKVILRDILVERLNAINSFDVRGRKYKFSENNIKQAITDLDEGLGDGLVMTSEKIYDLLLLGKSYSEIISNTEGSKSYSLNYIDWENPRNNVFHVVEEFDVDREDGLGTARPDLVTFINGVPFGVIECKKASISIDQGISQMLRNEGKDYIPNLFKFVQLVMSTNKNEAKYATVGTEKKFWSIWKEDKGSIDYKWFKKILENAVVGRIPTTQDKNIVSLFHPKRVLDFIKFFIVYDKNVKKIARYQQYFAIKEIIKTIEEFDQYGNRKSGVIWHTQGSGKSLTMVMLAKYIFDRLAVDNPKVLVITDRIELDSQINQTFNHSRLKANKATTGKNLVELINDKNTDIITSLVHKFDTASNNQKPILSKNIFVLIDESHRTQYGELNNKMKKVFPNACYLGFTGTPLMKKDKNTMRKFGGSLIHKYTIKDGVDDGAIVPLLYEGRLVEQSVNSKAIDKRLAMITRNLSDKAKKDLENKWSNFTKIASSSQRISLIADDIHSHYVTFYKNTFAKAMLATASKYDAVRYQEFFEEYTDIKTAVVVSAPDLREGYDEVDEEPKEKVIKFWKKTMAAYNNDAQKYENHVKNEFVNGDEIDILIVVDKLLTGFDAPRASILYIDKPMKDHTLLQAIARINRLYDGKDFGLVVDYRGLIEELNEAMNTYSGAGLEAFDPNDLQGALVDVITVLGKLREAHTNLLQIFSSIVNKKDEEEYEVLLADESIRNDFYKTLGSFGKYLALSVESEVVYQALGDAELKTLKKDLKFYQELRAVVKIRYTDAIDNKAYEGKMRNLMDTYIAAEEVIKVIEPVDILNEKGLEEELERLASPRGRADAISSKLTKSINEKWDEDPAFYKKFSKRITDILAEYREKRISAIEYLEKMKSVMFDYRTGNAGIVYPENIKNNPNAQAFYGVVKETLEDESFYEGSTCTIAEGLAAEKSYDYEGTLATLAEEIDKKVEEYCKVDWRDNQTVHDKIKQELDDLLFNAKQKYFKKMSFPQMDVIIEKTMIVALRRYS